MSIKRFGESNVLGPIYIDIYKFCRWVGLLLGSPYIFSLLFIKMENVHDHDLY